MAFCSSCGAHLEGDERFCVKCGHDVKANGEAAPAVAASMPVASASAPAVAAGAPVAIASAPAFAPQVVAPPPPQGYAPPPQGYAPPPAYPGQPPIPIIMGAPPVQSKRHVWVWVVVIIILVLYGLYYIGTHDNQAQQGTNPQTQQPAPVQPGVQGQQPGAQPGAYPAQQPGGQGQQGGANVSLAQQESFSGQVGEANGQVQISNGRWTNNATVAVQSVTLECIQFDANGAQLTRTQNSLNGPLQPQSSTTFNPFQMGAVVQGATRAQCGIVGAIPAN